jgi:GTP-binding protein
MQISSAKFISSSPSLKFCPSDNVPEFAFIGRSNVGKSSLINMITGIKGLAKVSGTPGKTRLINHFLINESWYLVDLPGIGFAKISKDERTRLERMIESYLLRRNNLKITFVLIDIRHEPQRIDLEFMAWLNHNGIPFIILFTKSDKISRAQQTSSTANYRKVIQSVMNIDPEFILTSSEKKAGRQEILAYIERVLEG